MMVMTRQAVRREMPCPLGERYGKATLAGGFFCQVADRAPLPAGLFGEQDQADHLHVAGAVVMDGMPFAVGIDGRVPGLEHDFGAVVVVAALAGGCDRPPCRPHAGDGPRPRRAPGARC